MNTYCNVLNDASGIARVVLDRVYHHNALDEKICIELRNHFLALDRDPQVKLVILSSNDAYFCAGLDLNWLADCPDKYLVSNTIADLMWTLSNLSKPTIAVVDGPAFGGGIGLVACCSIAIASRNAYFRFSEVRLGLVPAVIAPYIVRAIGSRQAQRYFICAEPFDADIAVQIGLIHELAEPDQLEKLTNHLAMEILDGSAPAISESLNLLRQIAAEPIDKKLVHFTSRQSAAAGASKEAEEKIRAFRSRKSTQQSTATKR